MNPNCWNREAGVDCGVAWTSGEVLAGKGGAGLDNMAPMANVT